MIVWAPATADDLHRIWVFKYRHNYQSAGVAEDVQKMLLEAGQALTATAGSPGPFTGLRKKFVDDYVLIFRRRGPNVEIIGVFHCREDWQGRILAQHR